MQITLTVNGAEQALDVEPRMLLVQLLRERLRLTGTHVGCDTSNCGACTVLYDGQPVKSCTMLGVQADGHEVTTVEGLASMAEVSDTAGLHPVQRAFSSEHGLQCGFCTPGMMLTSAALLARDADPPEDEIRWALAGNLCRCTGYVNIVKAVRRAAVDMTASSERPGAAQRTEQATEVPEPAPPVEPQSEPQGARS